MPPTLTPTPTVDAGPDQTADVGDYAILGLHNVRLGQGSDLHSGQVGVQNASRRTEVAIGRHVTFHDPASDIAGDTVKLMQGARVFDIFYNDFHAASDVTYGRLTTPLELPLVTNLPPLPQVSPGTTDYTVAQGQSLVLPAGAYGDIKLKKDSVLTLTGGIYHLADLELGDNSQMRVTAPAEVRIAHRLASGREAIIGPAPGSGLDATDLVFFVAGINGDDDDGDDDDGDDEDDDGPLAAVVGSNKVVTATIYAPMGTLWLRQGTQARGAFIGRDVKTGKDVQAWLESAFAGDYPSP